MEIKTHPQLIVSLLKDKPHAVGAEIGIFLGAFAGVMLRHLPNIETYYCVDPWSPQEDFYKLLHEGAAHFKIPEDEAYKRFLETTDPFKDKRVILRMTSVEALDHVEDESLDWVFIDANHSYEYVKPDIIGWSEKVKPGGLIAGHDFHDRGRAVRETSYGVEKAVRELIPNFEVKVNTWWTWK